MRNDLNRRDDDPERPRRNAESSAPLSDREVPLAGTTTSDMINRWLDGEMPEPTTMRGDAARHVEFWRRIGEETELRRQTVTPAHLPAQIMAAITNGAMEQRVELVLPWYRRTVEMSAAMLLAAAAGLLVVGALAATMFR